MGVLWRKYHRKGLKRQVIANYIQDFKNHNHELSPSAYWAKISLHRRKWEWNRVEMTEEALDQALSCGWRRYENRNRGVVFKSQAGSVEWYPKGNVWIDLKGSSSLGAAKALFCSAFSWLPDQDLLKLCEGSGFSESSRHWVFQGAMKRGFEIRQFEKSLGLRIYNDGSHTNDIEVEQTEPFWLDRFEREINAHLELIKLWQNEARRVRKARVRRAAVKPKFKPGLWDRVKKRLF